MAKHGRLIDADALMSDCKLAQNQADRHGREFANAFYSGGGEISTEWWCVEDLIENAPTIESKRKTGRWYKPKGMMPPEYMGVYRCSECDEMAMRDWKHHRQELTNFCPNCGARMKEGGK